MVTCWDCLKTLPYYCSCPVSDKTKSLRWAEKVTREAELFAAILEGFKPTVKINDKSCKARTKIIDVGSIEINTEDATFADDIIAVLLDRNGVPLYRRKFSKQRFVNVGYIALSWRIGTWSFEDFEELRNEIGVDGEQASQRPPESLGVQGVGLPNVDSDRKQGGR